MANPCELLETWGVLHVQRHEVTLVARVDATACAGCNDLLNPCSSVASQGNTHDSSNGRRDQTLYGTAPVGAGDGDCCARQLLGWHLSRSGRPSIAVAALEQILITRCGTLGLVGMPLLLRSENGLVLTSGSYTRPVRSYGLKQELITPRCPQQTCMVERVTRTLKEQCVHRHRFENQQHANHVISDRIQFFNHRRPHQALGMKTPAGAYDLVA